MAVEDLYLLCREYLDACSAAVALAPGGAIARAYVSPGPPAWDCPEQLTVHAGGPSAGDTAPLSPPLQPGHRIQTTGMVDLVSMTATILRCSPTGSENGPPSAFDLEEAAKNTLGDVWSIWNYIANRKRDDTLWGPRTREVFFEPAVSLQTAGGVSGWQLQIRVYLPGYSN